MVVYIVTAAFILLDLVTGIVKAFAEKNYSSSIMRQGLFHKTASVLCVVFGIIVDHAQGYLDLGISIPVALSICTYICTMEIGSIIENLCIINPNFLPEKLREHFQKLNDRR